MTLTGAFTVLLLGLLMVAVGVTWLLGPWGLIGSGIAIAGASILLVELKPERDQERETPEL